MLTGRESWIPDELGTAGRENLDAAHVARYDDKEDGNAAEDVTMLVDLGIGTGQFTLAVAPFVRRVVAVDVSPVMLERLRAKVQRSALTNVDCVQARFLTYEHVDDGADLIYSRDALHHLPDFWKARTESTRGGPGPNSRNTSVTRTAPSPGCSNP